MRGIELPIFYLNEATAQAEELDITMPLTEYNIKPITFYNIECIAQYEDEFDDGKPYSVIFANADKFTCALTYEELKKRIESHES
jgi:hypothetical protein